jgi:hypothetical protein
VVEVVEEADREDRDLQILDAKATGGMTQIWFLCNMTWNQLIFVLTVVQYRLATTTTSGMSKIFFSFRVYIWTRYEFSIANT